MVPSEEEILGAGLGVESNVFFDLAGQLLCVAVGGMG